MEGGPVPLRIECGSWELGDDDNPANLDDDRPTDGRTDGRANADDDG